VIKTIRELKAEYYGLLKNNEIIKLKIKKLEEYRNFLIETIKKIEKTNNYYKKLNEKAKRQKMKLISNN